MMIYGGNAMTHRNKHSISSRAAVIALSVSLALSNAAPALADKRSAAAVSSGTSDTAKASELSASSSTGGYELIPDGEELYEEEDLSESTDYEGGDFIEFEDYLAGEAEELTEDDYVSVLQEYGEEAGIYDAIPEDISVYSDFAEAELPASYDTRDYYDLPAVRNQGQLGTCWAHAVIGEAEIQMVKKGLSGSTVNLSEAALAYFIYNMDKGKDPLGLVTGDKVKRSSGSFYSGYRTDKATIGISGWFGMIPEYTSTSYKTLLNAVKQKKAYSLLSKYCYGLYIVNPETNKVPGYNRLALKDSYFINASDRDMIKKSIMNYGAVIASYCSRSPLSMAKNHLNGNVSHKITTGDHAGDVTVYNVDNNPKPANANHAVLFVGWDDNYPRENFNEGVEGKMPKNNGAWIFRNSWGINQGNKGYFVISYEDPTICDIVANNFANADSTAGNAEYQHNYHYDGTANNYWYRIPVNSWAACKYTIKGKKSQRISAVNIGSYTAGTTYAFMLWKWGGSISKSIVASNRLMSKWVYATMATNGIRTIRLPQEDSLVLNPGESFVVAAIPVKTSDSSKKVKIMADMNATTTTAANVKYTYTHQAKKGVSFLYSNNKWYDTAAFTQRVTWRLKIFTNDEENSSSYDSYLSGEGATTLKSMSQYESDTFDDAEAAAEAADRIYDYDEFLSAAELSNDEYQLTEVDENLDLSALAAALESAAEEDGADVDLNEDADQSDIGEGDGTEKDIDGSIISDEIDDKYAEYDYVIEAGNDFSIASDISEYYSDTDDSDDTDESNSENEEDDDSGNENIVPDTLDEQLVYDSYLSEDAGESKAEETEKTDKEENTETSEAEETVKGNKTEAAEETVKESKSEETVKDEKTEEAEENIKEDKSKEASEESKSEDKDDAAEAGSGTGEKDTEDTTETAASAKEKDSVTSHSYSSRMETFKSSAGTFTWKIASGSDTVIKFADTPAEVNEEDYTAEAYFTAVGEGTAEAVLYRNGEEINRYSIIVIQEDSEQDEDNLGGNYFDYVYVGSTYELMLPEDDPSAVYDFTMMPVYYADEEISITEAEAGQLELVSKEMTYNTIIGDDGNEKKVGYLDVVFKGVKEGDLILAGYRNGTGIGSMTITVLDDFDRSVTDIISPSEASVKKGKQITLKPDIDLIKLSMKGNDDGLYSFYWYADDYDLVDVQWKYEEGDLDDDLSVVVTGLEEGETEIGFVLFNEYYWYDEQVYTVKTTVKAEENSKGYTPASEDNGDDSNDTVIDSISGGIGKAGFETSSYGKGILGTWSCNAEGNWFFTVNGNQYKNSWVFAYNPYITGVSSSQWFWFDENGIMRLGWMWIKGGDGLERCYYLSTLHDGTFGACQLGGVTPDGYTVNSEGAWTVDGVVQTRTAV